MSIFSLFRKREKYNGDFKFKDAENKAIFTFKHVTDKDRPILYVEHDKEGDWQFLCVQIDHSLENAKIISLKEIVELDNTMNDLYEMPIGVGAERIKVGKKWNPFKLKPD